MQYQCRGRMVNTVNIVYRRVISYPGGRRELGESIEK